MLFRNMGITRKNNLYTIYLDIQIPHPRWFHLLTSKTTMSRRPILHLMMQGTPPHLPQLRSRITRTPMTRRRDRKTVVPHQHASFQLPRSVRYHCYYHPTSKQQGYQDCEGGVSNFHVGNRFGIAVCVEDLGTRHE